MPCPFVFRILYRKVRGFFQKRTKNVTILTILSEKSKIFSPRRRYFSVDVGHNVQSSNVGLSYGFLSALLRTYSTDNCHDDYLLAIGIHQQTVSNSLLIFLIDYSLSDAHYQFLAIYFSRIFIIIYDYSKILQA